MVKKEGGKECEGEERSGKERVGPGVALICCLPLPACQTVVRVEEKVSDKATYVCA